MFLWYLGIYLLTHPCIYLHNPIAHIQYSNTNNWIAKKCVNKNDLPLSLVFQAHDLDSTKHYLRLKFLIETQVQFYIPKPEEDVYDLVYSNNSSCIETLIETLSAVSHWDARAITSVECMRYYWTEMRGISAFWGEKKEKELIGV